MVQNTVGDENQRPQPAGEVDGRDASRDQSRLGLTSTYASDLALHHGDATIDDVLVPGLEELDVNIPKQVISLEKQDKGPRDDGRGPPPAVEDRLFERERAVTMQYLLDNVAEFRELNEIRKKVSRNFEMQSMPNSH